MSIPFVEFFGPTLRPPPLSRKTCTCHTVGGVVVCKCWRYDQSIPEPVAKPSLWRRIIDRLVWGK